MTGNDKKMVKDPVCGMLIDPAKTPRMIMLKGQKHYFCSPGCLTAFRKDPGHYLKTKGFIARFLDRLARSNENEFGPRGPCCH